MALTVGELVGYLRLDDQQFHTGLQRAETGMRGTEHRIQASGSRLGQALGTAGKAAATALTAAAAAGIGLAAAAFKGGVSYNALQQSSRAALTTILKSAGAANAQMDKLDDFARNSPFAKQVFIRAQQQLLGFGLAANKVIPALDAIQNAVAAVGGSNEDIAGITESLAKMRGQGKLAGDTLNELGNYGIDAATLIGSEMGKTSAEIRKLASKPGGIPVDQIWDPLVTALQKRFGGAAANVKQTWVGATDRIKGAWRDIGSRLAEPFVSATGGGRAIEWVNKVADVLRALEKQVTPLVNTLLPRFGFVFDRVTPTLNAAKRAIQGIDLSQLNDQLDKLGRYTPVIAGVGTAIVTLSGRSIPVLGTLLGGINPVVAGLAALAATSPELRAAGSEILRALSPLGPVALDIGKTLAGILSDSLVIVADLVKRTVPIVESLVRSFTQADGPIDLVNAALHLLPPTITAVSSVLGPAIDIVGALARGFEALPGPVQTAIVAFAALRLASSTLGTHIGGPVTNALRGFGDNMRLQARLAEMEGRKISGVGAAISTGMTRGLSGARSALGGVVGILGGPWGIALAGASLAIGHFAKKQAEAKAHSDALKASLDEATGAITDMTAKTVAQKLESEGVAEIYQRMGGNLADLTAASLGQADAQRRVNAVLDEYRAANEQTLVQDGKVVAGAYAKAQSQDTLNKELAKVNGAVNGQNKEVSKAQAEWNRLNQLTGKSQGELGKTAQAMAVLGDETKSVDERVQALRDSMNLLNDDELDLQDAQAKLTDALDRFRGSTKDADGKTKGLSRSLVDAKGNVDTTTKAGVELHRNLRDISTAALQAAVQAHDYAKANGNVKGATKAAEDQIRRARDEFVKAARDAGLSEKAANDLADAYGLLPATVATQIKLSGVPQAVSGAKSVVVELGKIKNKNVTITTRYVTQGRAPANANMPGQATYSADGNLFQAGAGPMRFASGGMVRQPMLVAGGAFGRGILWGEPETGWEAYISGKPGMERRNEKILAEAARRLGYGIVPQRTTQGHAGTAPAGTAGPGQLELSDVALWKLANAVSRITLSLNGRVVSEQTARSMQDAAIGVGG